MLDLHKKWKQLKDAQLPAIDLKKKDHNEAQISKQYYQM
jgi:hypothetical protein